MTFAIEFWHNPACGTSRNALQLVRDAGYAPVVVEYLKTPPSAARIAEVLAAMGEGPRHLIRTKGTPYAGMGLDDPALTDDALLAAMAATPVLINRPVVITPKGMKLCRPSEVVLDLLERLPPGPWAKEDGELIIDAGGRRVK